ncbi:MAG: MerR family transcriptional regulator [Spirosomataceae bacterium]
MKLFSVKQLAKIAGVSVRTLHLYDEMGLLKPATRTEARYRMYGEKELLRLQQILFYRELDFELREIKEILDNGEFDLLTSLQNQKQSLKAKQNRIFTLIQTIDKTIKNLKTDTVMTNPIELYEGLSEEKASRYRTEAINKYGMETIEKSEIALMKLSKTEINLLKADQKEIAEKLFTLKEEDFRSEEVQALVALHYQNIRQFWGTVNSPDPQAEAYAGLGQLYVDDPRFTQADGQDQPAFARFMQNAMEYFAATL